MLKDRIPAANRVVVDGKMLARASDALARVAKRLRVPPLEDFFSADPGAVAELTGGDPAEVPPEKWLAPEEGLRTVSALVAAVRARKMEIEKPEAVLSDLLSIEKLLVLAKDAGTQFHVAIDM